MQNILNFQHKTVPEIIRSCIRIGFDYTRLGRKCGAISDEDFVYFCIDRVFSQCTTGRDWLQRIRETGVKHLERSTFFAALHSERRAQVIQEVSAGMAEFMDNIYKDAGVDHFSQFEELNGYEIFAGDGHSIQHASHSKKYKEKNVSPSTIYMLNLRTGTCRSFANVSGNGSHRHELPVLRSSLKSWNKPSKKNKGRIIVYDRAATDCLFWADPRVKNKPMLVCRTKKNMRPFARMPGIYDKTDPVNEGVKEDNMLCFNNAGIMREVVYEDPETGKKYDFLTTLPEKVRPGVVALLYLRRWQIEKMFDNFKNDFGEKKAWATGECAQQIHAALIAMAYNIARALQQVLEKEHKIPDKKAENKFQKAMQKREIQAKRQNRKVPYMRKMTARHRIPKLSAQFIRSLRNHLRSPKTLGMLLSVFAATMTRYL